MTERAGNNGMEARLAVLEATVPRIDQALQKIANSLESLARLETAHQNMSEGLGRAFAAIERLEKMADERFERIEQEMPTMKLVRTMVLWFGGLCTVVVISYILYKVGLLVSGGTVKLP
jgi:hypothetical protein